MHSTHGCATNQWATYVTHELGRRRGIRVPVGNTKAGSNTTTQNKCVAPVRYLMYMEGTRKGNRSTSLRASTSTKQR